MQKKEGVVLTNNRITILKTPNKIGAVIVTENTIDFQHLRDIY